MISAAIQAVVQAVIPNTYQSMGDEEITIPYCIHEENDTPEYLKEGLSGYSWLVEIGIVHSTPDAAEALAVSVIAAVEALAGTTNNSTIIDTVEYQGSEPGFDQVTREYLKLLRFNINTKNR
jgi:hypothetical protein